MTSTFPTQIDTFPDLSANPHMNDPAADHLDLHTTVNEAIVALETKVGVTDDPDSLEQRVTNLEEIPVETPTGTINGINRTFVLSSTPRGLRLFLNGLRISAGASNDYTLSGRTITMNYAPQSGDVLQAEVV